MITKLLPTSTDDERALAVDVAVRALRAGEVVALPTETVYGLAADALDPVAVTKIFEAKERPFFDPLIVHLPDQTWLGRVARTDEVFVLVEELAQSFWPGPLTMVLPRWSLVPDIVTAGLETVAVRMSAHSVFSAVVRAFGRPLAAPSANRFGRISPTSADHVMSELAGRIPLIVDAGPADHGIESTIVKVEPDGLTILRAGPITAEDLEVLAPVKTATARNADAKPDAPGQLASHYAPRTRMVLIPFGDWLPKTGAGKSDIDEPGNEYLRQFVREVEPATFGVLAFRKAPLKRDFACIEVLSPDGDLREVAATLFSKLRRLDESGVDLIIAEPVPEFGLGIAIMDRLRKAAANPR
ncbi:MAG: L-threonylcarbamoyladenylate synthase [Chthoniobacteraceae bacterium]